MKVDFEHGIDILVLFSALEVPPKSTLLYIYYEKKNYFLTNGILNRTIIAASLAVWFPFWEKNEKHYEVWYFGLCLYVKLFLETNGTRTKMGMLLNKKSRMDSSSL